MQNSFSGLRASRSFGAGLERQMRQQNQQSIKLIQNAANTGLATMRQSASFAPRAESNNLPGMSEAVNSLIANMQRQQELKQRAAEQEARKAQAVQMLRQIQEQQRLAAQQAEQQKQLAAQQIQANKISLPKEVASSAKVQALSAQVPENFKSTQKENAQKVSNPPPLLGNFSPDFQKFMQGDAAKQNTYAQSPQTSELTNRELLEKKKLSKEEKDEIYNRYGKWAEKEENQEILSIFHKITEKEHNLQSEISDDLPSLAELRAQLTEYDPRQVADAQMYQKLYDKLDLPYRIKQRGIDSVIASGEKLASALLMLKDAGAQHLEDSDTNYINEDLQTALQQKENVTAQMQEMQNFGRAYQMDEQGQIIGNTPEFQALLDQKKNLEDIISENKIANPVSKDTMGYQLWQNAQELQEHSDLGLSRAQKFLKNASSNAAQNIALAPLGPQALLATLSMQGIADSLGQDITNEVPAGTAFTKGIVKFGAGYAINSVGVNQLMDTLGKGGARKTLGSEVVSLLKNQSFLSSLAQSSPALYSTLMGATDNALQAAAETIADYAIDYASGTSGYMPLDQLAKLALQSGAAGFAAGGLSGAAGSAVNKVLSRYKSYAKNASEISEDAIRTDAIEERTQLSPNYQEAAEVKPRAEALEEASKLPENRNLQFRTTLADGDAQSTAAAIVKSAETQGHHVIFVENDSSNGRIGADGNIYLDSGLSAESAAKTYAANELVAQMEQNGGYAALAEFIKEYAPEKVWLREKSNDLLEMHQIEQPLESFSDYAKYIEQKHTRNGLTVSPESAMQEAVAEWCSENFLGRKRNTESSHPERTAEAIREFCKKEPAAAQKAAEILEEYQGLDSEIANLADGLKQNFANSGENGDINPEFEQNLLNWVSKESIIKDGSHMENGRPKPNVVYQTGEHEYIYQTDENGFICRVTAVILSFKKHERRLRNASNTYGKMEGDEAGHLIGDRFGGSRKLDNLVSQAKEVNRIEYRRIEDEWAAALKNNQKVSVDISIHYSDQTGRPSWFDVKYTIDGKTYKKTINNRRST